MAVPQLVLVTALAVLCGAGGVTAPVAPSVDVKPVSLTPDDGDGRPVCGYYSSQHVGVRAGDEDDEGGGDEVLPGGREVRCSASSDYCFSYWTYEGTNVSGSGGAAGTGALKWLAQGCFSVPDACVKSDCSASRQSPANTYFCCCRGHLCNERVGVPQGLGASPGGVVSPLTGSSSSHRPSPHNATAPAAPLGPVHPPYWLMAAVAAFLVTSAAALLAIARWRRWQRKNSMGDEKGGDCHTMMGGRGVEGAEAGGGRGIDVSTVTLLEVIGRGRFGVVYLASCPRGEVVVKVFNEDERESYENELFIYSHPFMDHPNLLACLGHGRLGPGELGMVLPYCSGGRLSSLLQERQLTWQDLCRVTYTATRGLAHLHAPIVRSGLEKPSMSHRDFNSRNLVLRPDLTCVVADLGLAVCVKGGAHSRPGRRAVAGAPPALNEAGSLRYMAPELLEGAVNLSECESALRQIDAYALGLVLWECLTRCSEVVDGDVPYRLPYEDLLGPHPRLDQMIEAVVREKRRPEFPTTRPEFEDGNGNGKAAALRFLRDTIEECWDADAEARLSAQCVAERLAQLPQLWGAGDEINRINDDSDSDSDAIKRGLLDSNDDQYITGNYSMDLLPQDYLDSLELPAYSEEYHNPAHCCHLPENVIYREGDAYGRSTDDASSNNLPSGDTSCSGKYCSSSDRDARYGASLSFQEGEEYSTRTMETLMSPSTSGQPNLVLSTGRAPHRSTSSLSSISGQRLNTSSTATRHPEDTPRCSTVVQRGSAAPVSVLHVSSSSSARDSVAIMEGGGGDVEGKHREVFQGGYGNVSKIWSRFVRKFRKDGKNSSVVLRQLLVQSPTNESVHGVTVLPLDVSEVHCSLNNNAQESSFKLLKTFILERQAVAPLYEVEDRTHGKPSADTVAGRVGILDNQANWCNTVPLRRHHDRKPANRPVSLEIKARSNDTSSRLGTYLSTSCNFRIPDEVTLRKSKTRVKTPRHPPLPRVSLNEVVTVTPQLKDDVIA